MAINIRGRCFLAAVLLVLSASVFPCRFHAGGESADGPILPGSSDIVLQSYLAQQTGEMEQLERLDGMPGYRRASWWLTLLSRQLEEKGLTNLYVVIVDAQMWSKVGASMQMSMELDIAIPEDRTNTLMLSEAALGALASQTLNFEQALDLRVMQIHQDRNRLAERLRKG